MSHHGHVPDDNNPFLDALQAMAVVFVPFLLIVVVGLWVIGDVPLMGVERGGEAAHHE